MSNIEGLTAALNLKRNISDSYTKTEIQGFLGTKANSCDLLQIHTSGSTYETITHIAFSNGSASKTGTSASVSIDPLQVYYNNAAWLDVTKIDFINSTLTTQSNPTRIEVKSTPNLSDIADSNVSSANISFGKPLSNVLANDPGYGTEAPSQHIMTSTLAYKISAKFDSTSNVENYMNWRVRDTNGSLQEVVDIRSDKSIESFGNINTNSISIQGTDLQTTLTGKQNIINDGNLTIVKTNGLQTALNSKVDDSPVLTNVPSGATFSYPEVWTGTSNTYTKNTKTSFCKL